MWRRSWEIMLKEIAEAIKQTLGFATDAVRSAPPAERGILALFLLGGIIVLGIGLSLTGTSPGLAVTLVVFGLVFLTVGAGVIVHASRLAAAPQSPPSSQPLQVPAHWQDTAPIVRAIDDVRKPKLLKMLQTVRSEALGAIKASKPDLTMTVDDVRANLFLPQYRALDWKQPVQLKMHPDLHAGRTRAEETALVFRAHQGATGQAFTREVPAFSVSPRTFKQKRAKGEHDWPE